MGGWQVPLVLRYFVGHFFSTAVFRNASPLTQLEGLPDTFILTRGER